jgi:hypothetical protein
MNTMKMRIALFLTTSLLLIVGCGGDDRPEDGMADTTDTMDMDMGMDMGTSMSDSLYVSLSGTAEVPGPGDPDGTGSAAVSINSSDGTVCYRIDVQGIGEPTAAHIHSGGATESGPPVVTLDIASGLSGCAQADAATIQGIQANPSNYYVNVHTQEFGGGAVRGQLGSGSEM